MSSVPQWAVMVALWILWPLAFGDLAGRILGMRGGRIRGVIAGLIGVSVSSILTNLAEDQLTPLQSLAMFVAVALTATVAVITLAEFIASPDDGIASHDPRRHRTPWRRAHQAWDRTVRYLQILRIFTRTGLRPLLAGHSLPSDPAALRRVGDNLAAALQEAGGAFIKLGQVLATRTDIVPPPLAEQLVLLQDRTRPIEFGQVLDIITTELGRPVGELFSEVDPTPLASASIGQVHQAMTASGERIVVKVQRPGAETLIRRDIDVLLRLAERLDRSTGAAGSLGAPGLVRAFAHNLAAELDYRIEAKSTSSVGAHAAARGSAVRVPAVVEELSTRRVLALELMRGQAVSRAAVVPQLSPAHRRQLATTLLEEFLHQLLDDGLFNADPHPGNVLIADDATLSLIDFGSVARLSPRQRHAVTRLLGAVAEQDPEAMSQSLTELATSTPRFDREALESALSMFLGQHLADGTASSVTALEELIAVLGAFDFQFDGSIAAVFRAFSTLEGTLRAIDPTFNIVREAQDLGPKLARRYINRPGQIGSAMSSELTSLLPLLTRLPRRADRLTRDLERGHLRLNVRLFDDEADVRLVKTLAARATIGLLSVGVGLISAVLLLSGPDYGGGGTSALPILGYLGLATATGLGVRVLVSISRERLL